MPVPRLRSPARTAPPPAAADPLAEPVRALLALLVSIERSPSGPAVGAFRAAIRRRGQNLVDTLGPGALADTLARVRSEAPEQAEDREAVITAAWAGLTGWTSPT